MSDRVAALQALFERIARTRMRGLPLVHPRLAVQALGFEADGGALVGMLVTPWFMNLVRLPATGEVPTPVGATRARRVGSERFDFIGAQEPGFGAYEACSLFSPMFEFADQEAAVATARAVLAALREQAPGVAPALAGPRMSDPRMSDSRRALLFGRAAPGARP